MKLLVTGGLGFIGSNLIRYMLSKYSDVRITNLDKLSVGANPANLKDFEANSNYKFVKGDIANRKLVENLVRQTDAIINVAAETHVDRSIVNPKVFFKSNALGTFTLLEAARKPHVEVFVHVSTDEVYGAASQGESFREKDGLNPSNPYSASKAAADMFVIAYSKTYDLKAVVTRCTNNFGPYQFPEKLVPKTIIRALLNLKIPIYGSGKQLRDWIYVVDHCEAIDTVLRKGSPGQIYNISAGNEIENVKLARLILKLLKKPEEPIEFVEDRPGHDVRYSLNSSKIRGELGWKPKHEFNKALEDTVQWYTLNKWWWKPLATEKTLHPTPWKLKA